MFHNNVLYNNDLSTQNENQENIFFPPSYHDNNSMENDFNQENLPPEHQFSGLTPRIGREEHQQQQQLQSIEISPNSRSNTLVDGKNFVFPHKSEDEDSHSLTDDSFLSNWYKLTF